MIKTVIAVVTFLLTALIAPNSTNAAELKFLCGFALASAMTELVPEFQRATGHIVTASYANVGVITNRVR